MRVTVASLRILCLPIECSKEIISCSCSLLVSIGEGSLKKIDEGEEVSGAATCTAAAEGWMDGGMDGEREGRGWGDASSVSPAPR